jgi:RNA polymerase sigma-70 factor (ECF subfamily)
MDETQFISKESHAHEVSETAQTRLSETLNFTELYRKNVTPIFYYLYCRVHNVADAEDLTSQTFVTALETLSKLRDPQKFSPWVFTIARNKTMDYFRKALRNPTIDYNEEINKFKPDGGSLSEADQDHLHDLEQLISHLSPLEQEYLRLRIVADLPFAEIASILTEPETRIKKKYYRLLIRLQTQLEKF